jgi:hypothetical protein
LHEEDTYVHARKKKKGNKGICGVVIMWGSQLEKE